MKNLLFSFEDLSDKDKAFKKVQNYFKRGGANIISHDIPPKIKRSAGVSYREMFFTFADSQQVTLRIKQTGDIFQVQLNGKVLPITNQDDHAKAIAEIVKAMEAGRAKFQKKQAMVKAKAELPKGAVTSSVTMQQKLTQRRDELKGEIERVRKEIADLKKAETPDGETATEPV
ncbi:MAG: hypothetical protein NC211_03580 [Alistipes senegalensis]|nr:hypothetical protein [Oxalobacter formigenes]MCM1280899.1 hypothetical protein [Alistipes senegalensis]